ncbi:insecticide toxin TcdB middle/N-terminal region family protein [Lysobacter gummosus]|nr:insecticide toxin TcdB middle/N-terminal region family protein [Lysobacter gummosus]
MRAKRYSKVFGAAALLCLAGAHAAPAQSPPSRYSLEIARAYVSIFEYPTSWRATEVGDLNGDGRADIASLVLNGFGPIRFDAEVTRQNSDGTSEYLRAPVPTLAASFLGTGMADVNHDGRQDLVITSKKSFDILLYGSDAMPAISTYTPTAGLTADVPARLIDVDGDGTMDIVTHYSVAGSDQPATPGSRLIVFKGDGQGGVAEEIALVTGAVNAGDVQKARSMAEGDFNHDGLLDLAIRFDEFDAAGQSWSYPIKVFLNDGTGGFQVPYAIDSSAQVLYLAAGDLNGDGRDDLAATGTLTPPDSKIHVFLQNEDGMLGSDVVYPVAAPAEDLEIADLDRDGRQDLLVGVTSTRSIGFYLQREGELADPVYLNIQRPIAFPWFSASSMAIGDLNGDGCTDVTVAGGAGFWALHGKGCVPPSSSDINDDRKSDLLWRDDARENLAIWRMDGADVVEGIGHAVGADWRVLATGDFQGDRKLDVIWTNGAQMQLWEGDGKGGFVGIQMRDYPSGWRVVAVGDVNGDGKADLLWRDEANISVALWVMQGAQVIDSAGYSTGPQWWVAGSGDFNGDGRLDVVWTDGLQMQLWKAATGLAFEGETMRDYPQGWELAATGDVDGDGKADLMWRYPELGHFAIWHMDGGAYVSSEGYLPGVDWRVAQTGDFTGDGRADIVWTNGSAMQLWQSQGASFIGVPMPDYPSGWSVVRR